MACRDSAIARIICDLLDCPCFRTDYSSDVITVELCGALKNVVAMGAGTVNEKLVTFCLIINMPLIH